MALCAVASLASAQTVLGWTEAAPSLGIASGYSYVVVIDGTPQAVANVACLPNITTGYDCTGQLPALGYGVHTLILRVSNGTLSTDAMPLTVDRGVDPCVATPIRLTVSQWPNAAPGSRRLSYAVSGPSAVTGLALTFGSPTTLRATDTRGCQATVTK